MCVRANKSLTCVYANSKERASTAASATRNDHRDSFRLAQIQDSQKVANKIVRSSQRYKKENRFEKISNETWRAVDGPRRCVASCILNVCKNERIHSTESFGYELVTGNVCSEGNCDLWFLVQYTSGRGLGL